MRTLIRFVTALYPRAWRERYGEEYAALLEDIDPSPRAAFNVFTGAIGMQIRTWNLGWIFAISAAVVTTAFAAEYFLVPVRYVSQGTLKMDGFGPLTQPELDSIVSSVREVESRPALTQTLTFYNLYSNERARMPMESVVDLMRRSVFVKPALLPDGSKGFQVAFQDEDPGVAQKVTRDLLARFIDNNVRESSFKTLQLGTPANLPASPTRRLSSLIYVALAPGALALALLLLLRRRALKQA